MERKVVGVCVDYTHDGKGVVKIDRMPIFVDNMLVGEKAEILITKKEKGYYLGRRLELLEVSPHRVKPVCDNYKYCGGCNIQHMDYEEQLNFKQKRVKDVLKRIGGVDVEVNPVLGMEEPYKYRNKVQVPIGESHNGQIIAGFYKQGTHHIIDMNSCHIEDEEADKILVTIKKLLTKFEIEACDIMANTGIMRYVIIRRSLDNGDVMVVFVTKNDFFPKSHRIVRELTEKHKNIKTVVQNINNSRSSVVLGQKEKVLFGNGYIEDKICGLSFKISAKAFYQVNPRQTEVLYTKAIEAASLSGNETVLDAYCGVGTIGLVASKHAKKVIGVEVVKDAVKNAKENALLNNINNAEFYHDDATSFINKLAKEKRKLDVVIMDPPRDGSTPSFIDAVLKLKPCKVVYISCEPSSLARDLKLLTKDYEVKSVQPVDMFPQTYHVETITLLQRKDIDDRLKVRFDLDNVPLVKEETKATYQEIKDYIFNKYNVKVSTLNIAQTKTKYGIIERECYNKPKDDDSRQPKCTREKEEMIVDALKHFKML